ncbi:MAG: 50S ribosomal protein L32 [Candidatus Lindowbacteria bacterium RIFCSPLOWO2_12_FULL_62_27]|nr:MAG: 50S ribosomal protein L32 [Candidatus Lindowbacteria bacterium RIFCSPLOWO2_12_FULL_62_27]OGH63792.1 MAG: 50S ribosomal protein L32 [Candidatus Lindowbacteria bacterium RIFCSPLOWO2_02_FULL_62_12]
MANPKRRFSKARTRTRRSQWKVAPSNTVPCPNCKSPVLPHHVCPTCGQYRGRQVIKLESTD